MSVVGVCLCVCLFPSGICLWCCLSGEIKISIYRTFEFQHNYVADVTDWWTHEYRRLEDKQRIVPCRAAVDHRSGFSIDD